MPFLIKFVLAMNERNTVTVFGIGAVLRNATARGMNSSTISWISESRSCMVVRSIMASRIGRGGAWVLATEVCCDRRRRADDKFDFLPLGFTPLLNVAAHLGGIAPGFLDGC